MKHKVCKHCGRPVYITVYNLGYCKKCIALAKKQEQETGNGKLMLSTASCVGAGNIRKEVSNEQHC